jgi:hypothetical protein
LTSPIFCLYLRWHLCNPLIIKHETAHLRTESPTTPTMSESQMSNWDFTECFRGAKVSDDVDIPLEDEEQKEETPTGKRKRDSNGASKSKVKDPKTKEAGKEEKKMTAKEKMDIEFAAILATRAAEGTNPVSFVALAGKNNSGGVFVPPECVFAFNRGDMEQFEKVKEAIVTKARKWKERCPNIPNPFWLIDGGTSAMPLTAVGGVDRGCTEIPTKKSKVVEEEVEKKSKRAKK